MIKSKRGFGLIQIILLLGLLGIFGSVLTVAMMSAIRARSTVEIRQNLFGLVSRVQMGLMTQPLCAAALGGQVYSASAATERGAPITLRLNALPVLPSATPLDQMGLAVDNIVIANSQNAGGDKEMDYYQVDILGSFSDSRNKVTLGRREIGRFFLLVDKASNNITSCFSPNAFDTGSMAAFCKILSGNYDFSTGKCI